ncbi:hypothetical protein MYX07_02750 [Patescibacteria group bacterium AH-259-L07]|nr:hypothetical protein [Patescibacteria group bacterium AH-259-L07]
MCETDDSCQCDAYGEWRCCECGMLLDDISSDLPVWGWGLGGPDDPDDQLTCDPCYERLHPEDHKELEEFAGAFEEAFNSGAAPCEAARYARETISAQ